MDKIVNITTFIVLLLGNSISFSQNLFLEGYSGSVYCKKKIMVSGFEEEISEEDSLYAVHDYSNDTLFFEDCFSLYINNPKKRSFNDYLSLYKEKSIKHIELVSFNDVIKFKTKSKDLNIKAKVITKVKSVPDSLKLHQGSLVKLGIMMDELKQIDNDFFLNFDSLKNLALATAVKSIPTSIFEIKSLEKLTLSTNRKFRKIDVEISEDNNSNIKFMEITTDISKKSVRNILFLKKIEKLKIVMTSKKIPNYYKYLDVLENVVVVYNSWITSDRKIKKMKKLLPNAKYIDLKGNVM